ncbi:MAG: hypothetical protein HQK89_10230 [Nitrospirae bacterium]|nr:hypothetical protein [Nitrospirota bacterium]
MYLLMPVALPLGIVLLPVLLPIGLLYLFAAINLSKGYGKLFCGGVKPTTWQLMAGIMKEKGLPLPEWLVKTPKSCFPE